jgi:hypothetical protein
VQCGIRIVHILFEVYLMLSWGMFLSDVYVLMLTISYNHVPAQDQIDFKQDMNSATSTLHCLPHYAIQIYVYGLFNDAFNNSDLWYQITR